MNSMGSQEKSYSHGRSDWQDTLSFIIILSSCFIILFQVFRAPLVAAGANPHPTQLAIFLLSTDARENEDKGVEGGLVDLLTIKLMQKPDIELVERALIGQLMDEYELTLEQLVDHKKALQLGRLTGADVTVVASSINKLRTKALWVKVINNASGIIKDIDCFSYKNNFSNSLNQLVEFVWAASISETAIKKKNFIAVGGFDDQSINDMQIDRGDEIRRFLEHKFASDRGVSVVARSHISPLLLERGLSQMGLSAATGESNSAQPAFTIVSGNYHVIRTSETIYIVNLHLLFLGRGVKKIKVQGASWPNLLQDIGNNIDRLLKDEDPLKRGIN